MRRWASAPFYGAFGAPLALIVRDLALVLLGAVAGGATAALAIRRLIRRG